VEIPTALRDDIGCLLVREQCMGTSDLFGELRQQEKASVPHRLIG